MSLDALLRQLDEGEAHAPSCALCGLMSFQAERYLTGVANDGVNNIPLRQRLTRQGGYCARHCAWLQANTHLLLVAILLNGFLKTRLERARAGKKPVKLRCEACVVEAQTSERLVRAVKRHCKEAELGQRLERLPLCLTHLEALCGVLPKAMRLQLTQRHKPLLENLGEVIRKHDYRFNPEKITTAEVGSVKRVLELFAGERSDL